MERSRRFACFLLCALLLAGCSRATPSAQDSPPEGATDAADAETAPGGGPDLSGLGGLDPTALPGRVIAFAAGSAGMRNHAYAIDWASGARLTLWETEAGANIADWQPAPTGGLVAYRSIQREPGNPELGTERLEVRRMLAGSEAVLIAGSDTREARLAGFVWSPDGSALAYGKRIGGAPSLDQDAQGMAPRDPAWELHVTSAQPSLASQSEDRTIWRAPMEALSGLELELKAWNPEIGRALVSEVSRDAGLLSALRLIDTVSGTEIERFQLDGTPRSALASPNGLWLPIIAALPGEAEVMQLFDLDVGGLRDLETSELGIQYATPLWSPDSRWLAWSAYGRSSGLNVGVVAARVDAGEESASKPQVIVDGSGSTALAYDPSGDLILVGQFGVDTPGLSRLSVHHLEEGSSTALDWQLPEMTWALAWVDEVAPADGE